jgi:riboflavin kinase/FMN adenylyltransferase
VFLFGFSGDLYGQVIDVALIGWIRAEEKFTSIDALMAQMNLDAERARDALARNPGAFPPLERI